VLGAEQVPPFWQGAVQTGVSQELPVHDEVQSQVLGAVQTPPFLQVGEQTEGGKLELQMQVES
jgi:hypothetical protein